MFIIFFSLIGSTKKSSPLFCMWFCILSKFYFVLCLFLTDYISRPFSAKPWTLILFLILFLVQLHWIGENLINFSTASECPLHYYVSRLSHCPHPNCEHPVLTPWSYSVLMDHFGLMSKRPSCSFLFALKLRIFSFPLIWIIKPNLISWFKFEVVRCRCCFKLSFGHLQTSIIIVLLLDHGPVIFKFSWELLKLLGWLWLSAKFYVTLQPKFADWDNGGQIQQRNSNGVWLWKNKYFQKDWSKFFLKEHGWKAVNCSLWIH